MLKYLILMLILLSSLASAATIHGTVYDFGLNIVKDVKVNIDTTPQQVIIAKDGKYSFNVPKGDYTITSEQFQYETIFATAEEKISIIDNGDYILDLILFQYLEDETSLLEDLEEVNPEEVEQNENLLNWLLIVSIFLISLSITYLGFRFFKARKYNEEKITDTTNSKEKFDNDLEKVINIIKKEGGRTTQKELRGRLGLSEAKVSLMITELEHKKVVKRIKKGRSNVIILN